MAVCTVTASIKAETGFQGTYITYFPDDEAVQKQPLARSPVTVVHIHASALGHLSERDRTSVSLVFAIVIETPL